MGRRSVPDSFVGTTVNRLTFIKRVGVDRNGFERWLFKCDCGGERVSFCGDVLSGKTKSCGCIYGRRSFGQGKTGRSKKRFYATWHDMMRRCFNCKYRHYKHWGGRGITVCAEWRNADTFIKWCEEINPRPGLTLDRIDNDGNYAPNNCRWVPMSVQAKNTRRNRFIEYRGEQYCITEFIKKFAVVDMSIVYRRMRNGMALLEAVFTPAYKVAEQAVLGGAK
jgi:hypothetical protein